MESSNLYTGAQQKLAIRNHESAQLQIPALATTSLRCPSSTSGVMLHPAGCLDAMAATLVHDNVQYIYIGESLHGALSLLYFSAYQCTKIYIRAARLEGSLYLPCVQGSDPSSGGWESC